MEEGDGLINFAEVFFKAIDVFGYRPQNAVHFQDVTCIKDIPYSDKGGRFTMADLYVKNELLNAPEKRPVIVYIHGGGFIEGDKNYRVSVSEYYADQGYYVFNINHRLPPDVVFPENIFDCVDALNFLPTLAERYPLDLDNIVLTGDSSGGYMCTYLAALKFNEELRDRLKSPAMNVNIAGLMLMCGIYNLEQVLRGNKMLGIIPEVGSMLLGYKLKYDLSNIRDSEYIDVISPSEFVNDKWCPAFICWSEDDVICINQGQEMAKRLKAVCPIYGEYFSKGLLNNHCYHLFLKGNRYAKECMQASSDFLFELFYGKGSKKPSRKRTGEKKSKVVQSSGASTATLA